MNQKMKMMTVALIAVFAFSAFAFVTANADDSDADDTVFVDSTTGLSYVLLADTTNVEVKATTPAELAGALSIPAKIYVTGTSASETQSEGSTEYTVTMVADKGFKDTNITGVTLPDTITEIGLEAFRDISTLNSISFAENSQLKTLGTSCFRGIPSLTQITLPEGLKTIGVAAFLGDGLTSVTIPASVDKLDTACFSGNASLTSITFADTTVDSPITAIPENFAHSVPITSITLPESIKTIGKNAFYKSGLTSVTIPASVETLVDGCFSVSASLTSITFADTSADSPITAIPDNFASQTPITSITLPESIKTIGKTAFFKTGLTSITLPAGIESMGESVFSLSASLATITFADVTDKAKITALPNTFAYCTAITEITLPATVTTLGDGAFQGSKLQSFTISDQFTSIGAKLFSNCKDLNTIEFSNSSITKIPMNFARESGLQQLTLPNTIKTIETGAFLGCESLTEITIPSSVETIGVAAFSLCTSLSSVQFEGADQENWTLQEIPENFVYGSKVSSITIPQSVTTIGKRAFYNTPLAVIDVKGTITITEDSLDGAGKKLPAFVGYYPAMSETITGIYKAIYSPETYKVTVNVTADGEFWAKSGSVINFGTSGTPLEMYLEAGEQEITLSSMGYESKTVTVTVNEEGTASVTETLTADPTNIALDRTAQSIQQALDNEKKTIYIRTNSDKSEIVEVAEAGTEIIIERTVDGQDIVFSGNFTFGTSSIELYNVKFDAAGEFISIKSGSIELYGDIFDGVVVLSGDVKLVGDVNVGDGVTIVFKDGSTLDTNGYMFNFIGMPSVQTSSATVTEEVLATYGFENFISVDPIGEEPITTIFAVDGDKYLDITIENPIGTEATTDYAGYYIGKWTLVNAEQNAVYYGGSNGALPAGATKMYLNLGDVPSGNYLLTISFLKNDGEAVAVSVDKPVSIYQGYILGMYYDGTDYHAIVKNLAGALTANTTIYAGAFYAVSIPGTQIEYVAYHQDALSATVSEDQINNVDFTLTVSSTFEADPIAFNPKYVASDAVYYGAQVLGHYDAKEPLSHAVSYLKFNGEYALYAYAIGPVAETEYTLTAHYTKDAGDIESATYTYHMDESGYIEINLAEDFKNDSAEVVDLTADGITVIYFDIAGTEEGTEKVALEALSLNL